jgi:murein DD-endopeptidase MepM/ murein hydrolase activator NlpD
VLVLEVLVLRVLKVLVLEVLGAFVIGAAVLAQAPPAVDVRARAIKPGEVALVAIDGDAPPSVRVFGRDWPAYPVEAGHWRALVGIDLDTKPGRYEMTVRMGDAVLRRTLVVQPRAFPTRRLTVDPNLVHPPPEMEARVEREARELHEIWAHPAPRRLWSEPFARPVADPANSAFGTRSIYNGEARPPHTGADFLSPSGRPIEAPNAGRIVLAAPQYFSGNTVIIDHGLGLFSVLAHLSQIDVTLGDTVTRGQIVGKVGATGRVTGPHLHWAVRLDNARVDPLSLLFVSGAGAPSSSGSPSADQGVSSPVTAVR